MSTGGQIHPTCRDAGPLPPLAADGGPACDGRGTSVDAGRLALLAGTADLDILDIDANGLSSPIRVPVGVPDYSLYFSDFGDLDGDALIDYALATQSGQIDGSVHLIASAP